MVLSTTAVSIGMAYPRGALGYSLWRGVQSGRQAPGLGESGWDRARLGRDQRPGVTHLQAQLRERMKDLPWVYDSECPAFLREAEALVEGKPAKGKMDYADP